MGRAVAELQLHFDHKLLLSFKANAGKFKGPLFAFCISTLLKLDASLLLNRTINFTEHGDTISKVAQHEKIGTSHSLKKRSFLHSQTK